METLNYYANNTPDGTYQAFCWEYLHKVDYGQGRYRDLVLFAICDDSKMLSMDKNGQPMMCVVVCNVTKQKSGKAKMDIFTSVFLIFYLVLLFFGSITSLIYTIETKQKLFTAWAPYVWPIKTLMLIGILLMLLQAFSTLFKDIAKVKERKI